MPVSVRNTDILFNDSTTQSSAGITIANAGSLGIGSVIMAFNLSSTALAMGGDTSGAGLFRQTAGTFFFGGIFAGIGIGDQGDLRNRTATFSFSGTTFTSIGVGTWRFMGPQRHVGTTYSFDSYGNNTGNISVGIYIRVA